MTFTEAEIDGAEDRMLARYLRVATAVVIAVGSVSTAAYASEDSLVTTSPEQLVTTSPEQPVTTSPEQPVTTSPEQNDAPAATRQLIMQLALTEIAPVASVDLGAKIVSRSLLQNAIADLDLVLVRTPSGARLAATKLNSITYLWSDAQMSCLNTLWSRESNWNFKSRNSRSGAYGIPQAHPGSKMASAGSDWRSNPVTQIKWGMSYVNARYGNPCRALSKSNSSGWY